MTNEAPWNKQIWTLPNLLSTARLVGVPVVLWLIFIHHDLWAFWVLVACGVTDYLDGKVARHWNLVTHLGQLLDPAADRLYIVSTIVALAWRGIIPWWLAVLLFAREAFVVALYPALRKNHLPIPPVHFIGKAATFCLIYGFPLVLLGHLDNPWGHTARPIGSAFVLWGTALYWLAGVMYARRVRNMVRQRHVATETP